MKFNNLFVLAITAISITLVSCDKEENQAVTTDQSKVEINDDTNYLIQDFIGQVNGVATRAYPPTDPNNPPQHALRMYLTGGVDCFDGNGSCLPEVIITPGVGGSTLEPGVWEGGWASTPQGKQLQQLVDNNQVTMRKDVNQSTHKEFYIYNGVKDKNLEIVVPVAYK